MITSAWIDLAKAGMDLSQEGVLDFAAVQQRAASGRARSYALARQLPATYAAFDVLHATR